MARRYAACARAMRITRCRMCDTDKGVQRTVAVGDAVGMVLGHDITEIVPGGRKGPAFKKGHVIAESDVEKLKSLGKERIYVLSIPPEMMHEDEAAAALAAALCGEGVRLSGEPSEGKINLIAARDGLLKVNVQALYEFNMQGEVMCATLHTNTIVKEGRTVAGTRAIPLVVERALVGRAVAAAQGGVVSVIPIRSPKAGLVVTGTEVFEGRIKDAFAPVITQKVAEFQGSMVGIRFAPDDAERIAAEIRGLIAAGADLIITTGGMSVDPDDVTRHAVRLAGATDMTYGSPVLPGAMLLVAYIGEIPVIGIPACGMYSKRTVLDLVLPRVLSGEHITRAEIAAMGHGGLCLHCTDCKYPICPFGK